MLRSPLVVGPGIEFVAGLQHREEIPGQGRPEPSLRPITVPSTVTSRLAVAVPSTRKEVPFTSARLTETAAQAGVESTARDNATTVHNGTTCRNAVFMAIPLPSSGPPATPPRVRARGVPS
jgi:hypothetical protein